MKEEAKRTKFYGDLDRLTRNCGLSRAELICALEGHKLDIMLNEGIIIIDGKVGTIKKSGK